jgi:hypothetical protein
LNVRGFAEPVEVYRIGNADRENSDQQSTAARPACRAPKRWPGNGFVYHLWRTLRHWDTLSPLAILLGLGSFMGAISPVFETLDAAQIRIPLQLFAVLQAQSSTCTSSSAGILRQQGNAIELTTLEKRKVNFVAGLSILALLAVAYETYVHIFVLNMSYFSPSL